MWVSKRSNVFVVWRATLTSRVSLCWQLNELSFSQVTTKWVKVTLWLSLCVEVGLMRRWRSWEAPENLWVFPNRTYCPIAHKKHRNLPSPGSMQSLHLSPDQIRQGFPLLMDQQDLPAWSHPPLHFPGKFCFLMNEEPALGCSRGRKDMLGSTGSTTTAPNAAQTPPDSPTSPPPRPKSISVL